MSDAERAVHVSGLSRGSWTLEAAEQVCADADTLARSRFLSSLVAKSLVFVDGDFDIERRYRFLETVRQYAHEPCRCRELLNIPQTSFRVLLQSFPWRPANPRHHIRLRASVACTSNRKTCRTALEWAFRSPSDAEEGAELAAALFWFWTKRGLYEEGRMWLEQARSVEQMPSGLRARTLLGLAHMHSFRGRHVETEALATEALALGRDDDDQWVQAFALFMQGLARFELGDRDAATRLALAAREAAAVSGELVQHGDRC